MKRLTALLLALTLLLSACGGGPAGEDLLCRAAGIPSDARLLTVDGRRVPADRYLYWLAYTCDYIAASYQRLDAAVDWGEDLDGQTLGDYAKAQALGNAVLYATVENWAERYGCVLTEEDQAAIAADWEEKAASYGGEEAYLAALARMGLDRAGAEALSADFYLYRRLFSLSAGGDSPLHPEEADLERFAADRGYLTASWLAVPLGEDPAAARARAAEAFAALNESPDPAAAFDALAQTYGTGGRATFAAGSGVLPESCGAAVQALDAGQWSGIVEAEDGFYILLRRELDREAVSADYFDFQLQSAADGAAVELSETYQNLSAGAFYDALTRARTALETAPADEKT